MASDEGSIIPLWALIQRYFDTFNEGPPLWGLRE